jgi:hypothetical protein
VHVESCLTERPVEAEYHAYHQSKQKERTKMKIPASDYVTLVEVLERIGPYEEFILAVEAVVKRLEVEGIRALVTVQFYADPGSTEAGILLTFTDRTQIMRHINMITEWVEFHQFIRTVKPLDVRVYGKLSAEAEEWVQGFGVLSRTFENHITGFVR